MTLHRNDIKRFSKTWMLTHFVFVLLSLPVYAGAQTTKIDWQAYMEDIRKSADNDHHVYLYYTRGGEPQKHFYCYQLKQQQVLAINVGDTLVKEVVLNQPDIFSMIADHRKYLDAIVQSIKTDSKRSEAFQKNFQDSTVNFLQLGIKIKDLVYSHFQRTTPEFIEGVKSKRLQEGYRTVNHLIDLLEKAAEKALAENQ